MAVSANRLELLQIADAVAREKSIDKQIVIAAMADAIQKAARSRYGQETNIRADINEQTGEMKLQRLMDVLARHAGQIGGAKHVQPRQQKRRRRAFVLRGEGRLDQRAQRLGRLQPLHRQQARGARLEAGLLTHLAFDAGRG